MLVNCPNCKEQIEIPHGCLPFEKPPRVDLPPPPLPPEAAVPPGPRPNRPPPVPIQPVLQKAKQKEISMKEYKVLTQKDRFFGGKFDPDRLEKAMNSYATEGWSVVSVATASIPSLTGTREEMIVVMEREK